MQRRRHPAVDYYLIYSTQAVSEAYKDDARLRVWLRLPATSPSQDSIAGLEILGAMVAMRQNIVT